MQIEDILAGDKQLAKEIMYDIRQAELAKEWGTSTAVEQAAPQEPPAQQQLKPLAGPSGKPSSVARASSAAGSPRPEPSPAREGATGRRQSKLRLSSGKL